MPLPALLGGLGRMGLGIATSTLGGLGMGFGYGFGVRAGYNAYKPSKHKDINNQVMSLNPIEAGNGMGRHVAEQQFGATTEPSLANNAQKLVDESDYVYSQAPGHGHRKILRSKLISRDEFEDWVKYGISPNPNEQRAREIHKYRYSY